MSRTIRTVLGDMDPADAGAIDSHDHLFLSTPVLPGDGPFDEASAASELRAFSAAGGGTLVQWTPRGLTRNMPALRRISESTGISIVCATGRHRAVVYPEGAREPGLDPRLLAAAFTEDIVKNACGLIKVGVGPECIAADEAGALHAAAVTHHTTGVPIAVHLEEGSASTSVIEALRADDVPERSIVLGHLGRNPSVGRILEAAESGAWLCMDTPSPRHTQNVDELARILATLIERGHLTQLLLGADTTAALLDADRPLFGPSGLFASVAPRLSELLGADAVRRMLIENPARAWSFDA